MIDKIEWWLGSGHTGSILSWVLWMNIQFRIAFFGKKVQKTCIIKSHWSYRSVKKKSTLQKIAIDSLMRISELRNMTDGL